MPVTATAQILSEEELNLLCEDLYAEDEAKISDPHKAWDSFTIKVCSGCLRDLNWPSPKVGFWSSPVPCPECGRWYFTECRNNASPLLTNVIPGRDTSIVNSNDASLQGDSHTQPSEDKEQLSENSCLKERRSKVRHRAARLVTGVPLTDAMQPTRMAMHATIDNVSTCGMKLVVAGDIEVPRFLLDFAPIGLANVQLLADIRWRHYENGVTELGCQFLHDLGTSLPLR